MEYKESEIPINHTRTYSQFQSVLLELKRLDETNLNLFLKKVLEVIANTLKIERVSIWFYDQGKSSISCYYIYSLSKAGFINESPVQVKDFPAYFNAIESGITVRADNALNNPYTRELSTKYLIPRKIKSMMDIPIYFMGNIIGIMCHEVTQE